MKPREIKEYCKRKNIHFIPHHPCSICGVAVGWNIYNEENQVYFCTTCDCSNYYREYPDTWDRIAEWVNDENGNLRDKYKELLKGGEE